MEQLDYEANMRMVSVCHRLSLINTAEYWRIKRKLDERKGRYGLDYLISSLSKGQACSRKLFSTLAALGFGKYDRNDLSPDVVLEYVEALIYEDT